MEAFDVIVIGGGAAGLTSAFTAAGFGKKVLMVEREKPGGECTWSGCIPSKALINKANDFNTAQKFQAITANTKQIMEQVRGVSEKVYLHETPDVIENSGVNYVQGNATFISSHVIRVGEKEFKSKKFIIATGSRPMLPPISGLDQVDYLTNENFFNQEELPKSIIVLGAGAIGVELSQAMARLGVKVTLIEMFPTILFREEPEFADLVQKNLEKDGVWVLTNHKATAVCQNESTVEVTLEHENQALTVTADKILVAVGRVANTESLGLESLGINVDRGIKVNAKLQTTQKHIYACGDVAGPFQLSHMANYQGKLATMNAILPLHRKVNYTHVSWAIFCQPELARAGLTEDEARHKFGNIRVYHYDLAKLDRAQTKESDSGKIKIITDKKGKILGAHILADRAGDLIAQVQTLKTLGINMAKLQSVIHPYPTYADALRQIAQQIFIDNIKLHPLVKLFRK